MAHTPHQRIDRQVGRFAQNVPQTVIKISKPSGRLVEPARALVQHLIEVLAVADILTQDLAPQNLHLVGQHSGGAAPANAGVRFHLDKVLKQRLIGGFTCVGVLGAQQAWHSGQFERAAASLARSFQHIESDSGDPHG